MLEHIALQECGRGDYKPNSLLWLLSWSCFGTVIVVGIGGYVAAGNSFSFGFVNIGASTIDVGTLILFLTYLKMLYQPMRDLSNLTTLASNGSSGAERIQEVLDQAPEMLDTKEPYDGPQKLKGEITLEKVLFGYTKGRLVLKGINLHIPEGRKVALVGHSGSGKTTLAKLIPRFYELEQGSLKIDGVENWRYPLQVLRQNISMVLQDSILFEGPIRENLEIARPGASMEQIIDAAKKANIHETIMRLPDAYETLVREQGNNFSAGQRQRLAIARAILRDAPILILDEPTANLDVEAEAEVMHAINRLIAGRTVLTISHRLSTLGNIDEILVMHDGQIVERGTFKELKRKNGIFAGLLEEQNRHNLDREEEDEEEIVRSAFEGTSPHIPALLSATLPHIPPMRSITSPGKPVIAHSMTTSPRMLAATLNGCSDELLESQLNQRKVTVIGEDEKDSKKGIPIIARVLVQMSGKIIGEYQLNKPLFTIGRFPTGDIQIPSSRVSRLHALIRWMNGAWVIEDAESLNGLTCQGERIDQLALVDGDRVSIDPAIALQYQESGQ